MEMAKLDCKVVQTCWNQSGLRMAGALTDGSIQVWDVSTHATDDLTLTAHWDAGVAGVSCPRVVWAPLEYGHVLASCSAEGVISIWEEVMVDGEVDKTWRLAASLENTHTPVLDMQFAAHASTGAKLVVVCADGHARIYESSDTLNLKHWQLQAEFQNSRTLIEKNSKTVFLGASACWRSGTFSNQQRAFVFGCNSTSALLNVAKVWVFEQSHQRWFCAAELREVDEEDKPVNHVSWAPNIGRSHEIIAVAYNDGLSIWQLKLLPSADEMVSAECVARLGGFEGEVWQVEWDMSGMTLASAGSDGVVRLWQKNFNGEWHQSAQI